MNLDSPCNIFNLIGNSSQLFVNTIDIFPYEIYVILSICIMEYDGMIQYYSHCKKPAIGEKVFLLEHHLYKIIEQ